MDEGRAVRSVCVVSNSSAGSVCLAEVSFGISDWIYSKTAIIIEPRDGEEF